MLPTVKRLPHTWNRQKERKALPKFPLKHFVCWFSGVKSSSLGVIEDKNWAIVCFRYEQILYKGVKLYVYKQTGRTKFLWLDFILYYMLYMFRTVSVHNQEQLYKLCVVFGIPIQQTRHTAYKKIVPEDGLTQSETCRAYIEKSSLIRRILCILLVYIHTVGWCTVRTASKIV